jgi:superfamily II DNA helicase RecQ
MLVCAPGMGVDKATLGAVVHLQMPRSLEDYVQQVGARPGRQEAPSHGSLC